MKVYNRAIQVGPGYFDSAMPKTSRDRIWKNPKGIRDISEWYTARFCIRNMWKKYSKKEQTLRSKASRKYWDAFGSDIDVFFIRGTDFRNTEVLSLILRYSRVLYALLQKMNDWIHENTTWKTLKHCCGGIFPILPYLIEARIRRNQPGTVLCRGYGPAEAERHLR